MKLYLFPASPNALKPNVVAYHVGSKLERVIIDLRKGEQKTPEFLKLNPNGKMPLLVDGDFKLWESSAIMAYLAHQAKSPLWPTAPQPQADVLRWLSWELAHWGPAATILIRENLVKKLFSGADPDPAEVARGLELFRQLAAILNDHLRGRVYVVGNALTIADYALAATLLLSKPAGIPVAEFSNIEAWFDRIAAEPAWQQAVEDGNKAMAG